MTQAAGTPKSVATLLAELETDFATATASRHSTPEVHNRIIADLMATLFARGLIISITDSEYGAVAGETDSSSKIQAAIQAASDTQAAVYIPDGTFNLLSDLTIPENTVLVGTSGRGFGASQLAFVDSGIVFDGSVLGSAGDTFMNILQNITISQTGSGCPTACIKFDNGYSNILRNIRMHDIRSDYGIQHVTSNNTKIYDLILYGEQDVGGALEGIRMEGGTMSIHGLDLEADWNDGIQFLGGKLEVYDPYIERCTTAVRWANSIDADEDNAFNMYGGVIEVNTSGNAIEVSNCSNCSVYGTDIRKNGQSGVVITNTTGRTRRNVNFWGVPTSAFTSVTNRHCFLNINGSKQDIPTPDGTVVRHHRLFREVSVTDDAEQILFQVDAHTTNVNGAFIFRVWGETGNTSIHNSERRFFVYGAESVSTVTTVFETEEGSNANYNLAMTVAVTDNGSQIDCKVTPALTGTLDNGGTVTVYAELEYSINGLETGATGVTVLTP